MLSLGRFEIIHSKDSEDDYSNQPEVGSPDIRRTTEPTFKLNLTSMEAQEKSEEEHQDKCKFFSLQHL